jgi:hypothetical protein
LCFYLIPVRLVIIKTGNNNKCWWEQGKSNTYPLFVEMQISLSTVQISMEDPQRVKDRTSIWSSYTAPGYVLKRIKVNFLHKYPYSHVYYSTIYTCQIMESASVPVRRWKDKENVVHKYYRVLPSHKDEWTCLFAGKWMELEIIILSEMSQFYRDKYHNFPLICGR